MLKKIKKLYEHYAVLLFGAAVLGVILGIGLGDKAAYLAPFGTIFTRLLKMLVPVLVFFSIASAFANIGDAGKLGKWAGKIIGYFLITTTIGCIIGCAVGLIFKPGQGITLPDVQYEVTAITADMFIDWLPENFVGCIAEGNTIQIVFLSIFVGLATIFLPEGKSKEGVQDFLNAGQDLILKIVGGIMYYAPIGIVGLMASSISELTGSFVTEMSKFLIAYSVAFVLQIVICYFGLLKFVGKLSPLKFIKKYIPAMVTAFTTTSSAATLPVNMECVENMGVDREMSAFGIPLGVTFNMDSMAIEIPLYIMLGIYAAGGTPNMAELLLFVIMGIAFSIGCAGVPGGGIAMAVIVVNAFGLPVQVVGWISAVFFYLDITGTVMNVWGDAVCTTIVAKTEGMLDLEKYNE